MYLGRIRLLASRGGSASRAPQVVIKQGAPKLRPFPGALKQWVLPASASTDFQYLLLCMLFLQARPMALVRCAILDGHTSS